MTTRIVHLTDREIEYIEDCVIATEDDTRRCGDPLDPIHFVILDKLEALIKEEEDYHD